MFPARVLRLLTSTLLLVSGVGCHGEEFDVKYARPAPLGQPCREEGGRTTFELGPCCEQDSECVGGSYQRHELQCDAQCLETCRSAQTKEDCRANDCTWLEPKGCFGETDEEWTNPQCVAFVDATRCPPENAVCPTDFECGAIYVDPCEGRTCSACVAIAYLCMIR